MTGEECKIYKKRQTSAEGSDLTDAVRLVDDEAGQKASFVQVVQGRDELVAGAHLVEERSESLELQPPN